MPRTCARVLACAGDRLDLVYFYDDVATQNSLMISKPMWRGVVRPRHAQLIAAARALGKPVMYHCDGAVYPLIPELLEMGVSVLNPIQPDAARHGPGQSEGRVRRPAGLPRRHRHRQDAAARAHLRRLRAEVRERVAVLARTAAISCAARTTSSPTHRWRTSSRCTTWRCARRRHKSKESGHCPGSRRDSWPEAQTSLPTCPPDQCATPPPRGSFRCGGIIKPALTPKDQPEDASRRLPA